MLVQLKVQKIFVNINCYESNRKQLMTEQNCSKFNKNILKETKQCSRGSKNSTMIKEN